MKGLTDFLLLLVLDDTVLAPLVHACICSPWEPR